MIEDNRDLEENGENEDNDNQLEKMYINKKREIFSTSIRASKKKQILNNNRVKMFQKYMKELNQDQQDELTSIKSLIPEYILNSPQKLQVYMDSLIQGFNKDFEDYNYNPNDYTRLYQSLNQLRRLSFVDLSSKIIEIIVVSDIHIILTKLIKPEFDSKIRFEAAWLLTNCLASDCVYLDTITIDNYILILEAFTTLYDSQYNEELFEIGIWGLTNLCVQTNEIADLFYEKYGFSNLEQNFIIFQNNSKIQEILSWMMTVFSRNWKIFKQDDLKLFLKLAEKQIMQKTSPVIQHYGIRILYQISQDDDICLQISKKDKFIDFLLSLTHNPDYISYIFAIIGNLIASEHNLAPVTLYCFNIFFVLIITQILIQNYKLILKYQFKLKKQQNSKNYYQISPKFLFKQKQKLLERNILEYLNIALDHGRVDVRKEAVWCLSNLFVGEQEEIQVILDYNRLMDKLFRMTRVDSMSVFILLPNLNIFKETVIYEIIIGLSNCIAKANSFQIMRLLQMGILQIFVDILQIQDVNITIKTIQCITFMLEFGEKITQTNSDNPVKSTLISIGFRPILQSLLLHPLKQIYEKAMQIIDDYFQDHAKLFDDQNLEDNEI